MGKINEDRREFERLMSAYEQAVRRGAVAKSHELRIKMDDFIERISRRAEKPNAEEPVAENVTDAPWLEFKHGTGPSWAEWNDAMNARMKEKANRVVSMYCKGLLPGEQLNGAIVGAMLDIANEALDDQEKRMSGAFKRLNERVEYLAKVAQTQNQEVQQICGKVLGYLWYSDDKANFPEATEADGVCVGDHTAETIAAELANQFLNVRQARDSAEKLLHRLSKITATLHALITRELENQKEYDRTARPDRKPPYGSVGKTSGSRSKIINNNISTDNTVGGLW